MAIPSPHVIREIITGAVAGRGLDVEDVRVVRAGAKSQVTVLVDGDTPPDLDALERVTAEVSAALDAAEAAGRAEFGAQPYTLEVSTPGVDHPLTEPRHWRRNRGRLVRLPGDAGLARIGALDPDGARVVLVDAAAPGGRGRGGRAGGSGPGLRVAGLGAVAGAVVEVEFGPAPRPEAELAGLDFTAARTRLEEDK
ncbi:hypothetical protein CSPHI_05445 [Corynebacterium sphenisci DSM 44792]|uniref:Ribosome maturation factor RimP n=1 Tax=Corynebacterium sphenisci DSM 44792 TaxID=1437874 RepID=A0A1L7CXM7_9CORY|nr:ribosome maturation factor RimP [Corynebacterium sphenisci]APT90571.1 hypothetical protein CSPHI_05445 [Corynebacterium sphenisci DSM 44792]